MRKKNAALKPLRVFISHKSKDEDLVMAIKQMVKERCTKMEVFASCDAEDLRGGDRWSAAIHNELNRADWLVLLYTTHSEDWDWCIYEAGYFAGRRTSAKTKTLAVIHPRDVMIPRPLEEWQSVVAEPKPLRAFLGKIFKPGSPRCHWTGNAKDLDDMAERISDAVRPLGGTSHELNRSMTVVVHGDMPVESGDLPKGAFVGLDKPTAELLGLSPSEKYPWPEFGNHARTFNFDIPALVKAVHHARNLKAVPPSLEQFRAPMDGQGYRPIITNVHCKGNGEIQLKLMFWAQSKANDPVISNHFERVRRLFEMATKFRMQVGEQHGNAAAQYRHRPPNERIQFLRRVLQDIADVSAESERAGLRDNERLLAAFNDDQRAEIEKMLGEWPAVLQSIKDAVATGNCDAPDDILRPLRIMNRQFLLLSAERLHQLVSSFPVPGATAPATSPAATAPTTHCVATDQRPLPLHGHMCDRQHSNPDAADGVVSQQTPEPSHRPHFGKTRLDGL